MNNYAVEPEMYIEEPGDLREKEEALKAERAEELEEINIAILRVMRYSIFSLSPFPFPL
jgi:hypothetical protein